jgi:hypothetical protein
VITSINMKKHGATVPPRLLRAGVLPYSIQNSTMTRHVMRGGAKFPPERVAHATPDDPRTKWSVPLGWSSRAPLDRAVLKFKRRRANAAKKLASVEI